MKKPKLLPLTDNPRCKDVNRIPLGQKILEQHISVDDENNSKNNSQSLPELESYKTN